MPSSLCKLCVVIALAFAALALQALVSCVHAQEGGELGGTLPDPTPHERYHEYYQRWRQPGSGVSCCNANEYIDTLTGRTHIYGDCEPTRAELRGGHWFALVPQYMIDQGVAPWVEIPDDKVVHEINPSPNEAHLCGTIQWTQGKPPTMTVLCFVPPFGGG